MTAHETYRPNEHLAFVHDPERTTLCVLDVEHDDNGRRPALQTHTYQATGVGPQRYWQLVEDVQLERWWEKTEQVSDGV